MGGGRGAWCSSCWRWLGLRLSRVGLTVVCIAAMSLLSSCETLGPSKDSPIAREDCWRLSAGECGRYDAPGPCRLVDVIQSYDARRKCWVRPGARVCFPKDCRADDLVGCAYDPTDGGVRHDISGFDVSGKDPVCNVSGWKTCPAEVRDLPEGVRDCAEDGG